MRKLFLVVALMLTVVLTAQETREYHNQLGYYSGMPATPVKANMKFVISSDKTIINLYPAPTEGSMSIFELMPPFILTKKTDADGEEYYTAMYIRKEDGLKLLFDIYTKPKLGISVTLMDGKTTLLYQ